MIGDGIQTGAWLCLAGAAVVVTAYSLGGGTGCNMLGSGANGGEGGVVEVDEPGGGHTGGSGGGTGGGPPLDGGIGANPPGGPPIPTDQCPSDEAAGYELDVDVSLSLVEPTQDYVHTDDYSSFCGGGESSEREDLVYHLVPQGRGTLTLSPAAAGAPPVVYVESECGVRTTFGLPPDQLPCMDALDQQIQLGVMKDQDLFVIVESTAVDGAYQVDLALSPPVCGDGVINPASDVLLAEDCDPGPTGAGGAGGAGGGASAPDGCDHNCKFEVPVGDEDTCPGIPAEVGQPVQGHTLGFNDDFQPACATTGGPDRLYYLGLQQGDTLHLSVEADFDVVLAVMEACSEVHPSHCQDSPGVSKQETMDFTATSSATYIVVVDGYDGSSWGTFTLTATKN